VYREGRLVSKVVTNADLVAGQMNTDLLTYEYDALGSVTRIDESFDFGRDGIVDGISTTVFQYDGKHRPIKEMVWWKGVVGDPALYSTTVRTYGRGDNLLEERIEAIGGTAEEPSQ